MDSQARASSVQKGSKHKNLHPVKPSKTKLASSSLPSNNTKQTLSKTQIKQGKQAGRPDKRVLKTRKAIMDAFEELITENKKEKITISDIARTAHIDRKTFYLHYKSVNELAIQKATDVIERILRTLIACGFETTTQDRMRAIFKELNNILSENLNMYSGIAARTSTSDILHLLGEAAKPAFARVGLSFDIEHNWELRQRLIFIAAGVWAVYADWLNSKRTRPLKSVSDGLELWCEEYALISLIS